jgi:membrane-bound serine protease (ClpP class)
MLGILFNPNLAYVLMMIGMVGLYFELSNPGLIFPGVIGAVSMALSLYAMQSLPIDYTGLLLVLLGALFFIAEIGVMSYGLLSLAGMVLMFLGSTMLIDSDDPAMQISQTVLYPTLSLTIAFSIGIIFFATQTRNLKKQGGADGMLGETGIVKEALNPHGRVLVHGEIWEAECEESIAEGEHVVIESVEGLKVRVKRNLL